MGASLIAHPSHQMLSRFYCNEQIAVNQTFELPDNVRHHAVRVLRLKQGDTIILFNGQGGEFLSEIISINKNTSTLKVFEYNEYECESPLTIELSQAICANEKMDWIIQKAVEMGVNRIQPISTTRGVIKLSSERAVKRRQHWQQIAIAACEQCGRNRLPEILPPLSLPHWLGKIKKHELSTHTNLLLLPTAEQKLSELSEQPNNPSYTLLIGPEGGFTPEEERAALHTHFVPIRVGKRILRTESAALATIAALQTLWGDY